MAFVNEKLTPEQRTEFEQRGIKNPVPHVYGNLKPLYWTIDYENDMCLVSAGVFREFPNEEYFVFIKKSKVILFAAKMHSISEGSIEWEIFKLINEVHVSAEVMGNIASSLTVFQASGHSREINTIVNVIFNIKDRS